MVNFYVANFLVKDITWIGDITGAEGEENYKMWQKRNQSLNYRFKEDIMYLVDKVSVSSDMIKVKDGQYPLLLNETMQGAVSIETLSILNHIMGFFEMWNKKISDNRNVFSITPCFPLSTKMSEYTVGSSTNPIKCSFLVIA